MKQKENEYKWLLKMIGTAFFRAIIEINEDEEYREIHAQYLEIFCRRIEGIELSEEESNQAIQEIQKMLKDNENTTLLQQVSNELKNSVERILESCIYRLNKRLVALQSGQKTTSSSEEGFTDSTLLREYFGDKSQKPEMPQDSQSIAEGHDIDEQGWPTGDAP